MEPCAVRPHCLTGRDDLGVSMGLNPITSGRMFTSLEESLFAVSALVIAETRAGKNGLEKVRRDHFCGYIIKFDD